VANPHPLERFKRAHDSGTSSWPGTRLELLNALAGVEGISKNSFGLLFRPLEPFSQRLSVRVRDRALVVLSYY